MPRPSTNPAMYVVTGPMASGKSTVGRLLAERFERGVHIEGDALRRNIVSGRQDMTPIPSQEALSQLRLRYELAAAAADRYLASGFTVVLEDVIADGYGSYSVEQFHQAFSDDTPRLGLWLDTSHQSPAETVNEILRRTAPKLAGA